MLILEIQTQKLTLKLGKFSEYYLSLYDFFSLNRFFILFERREMFSQTCL